MAITPDFYKSVNMNMAHRIAMLENEVNLRDAYIGLLHQKIEVSVDLGWHTELAEAMIKKPEPARYTQGG